MAAELLNITGEKAEVSVAEIRGVIARIEEKLLPLPQLDIPITNYFSKDVYAREMFLPKGAILVGKIHKYQNLNIMSQGDVAILSIDGVVRVKAPYTLVASPGAKRVFYAHEDTVWTCIHGTSETNVDEIEAVFIAKDYADVELISEEDFNALREAK